MENKQQTRKADELDPPPGTAEGMALEEETRKQKAHQKAITRGLRKFFDDVTAEPVPDEFMALLKKMDENGQ